MSKVLLSGATGFIGSNLFMYLLERGEQVRAIPRDLMYNYFSLKEYLELEKPDVIIHLAAYGNHSKQHDLDKIASANIGCTVTLLQASRDIPYKALINISTSSVDLERQTFYSATKRGAEEICKAFHQETGKPIATIRPYSIYGEGEADFRFIPTVIKNAKEESSFNLVPEPSHDWTYVKDFISGVETVVKNIDKCKGKSINVGTGHQYTNQQIVDTLESIHGKKLSYKIVSQLRPYDQEHWVADNSFLVSLGWKQKYPLKEGLRRTYESY